MAGRRGWRGLIEVSVGLVAAMVLAGCASTTTSEPAPSGEEPTTSVGATSAEPARDAWVAAELPVHSRLSATNDSIVFAGVLDADLVVAALDPESGAERWRRRSVVSDRIRGVELTIFTDDDTAYFLTDKAVDSSRTFRGGGRAGSTAASAGTSGPNGLALTAVETATGEQRWMTELSADANPNVSECGPYVCVFVSAPGGQELWSFDRASGEVVAEAPVSFPSAPGNVAIVATAEGDGDDTSEDLTTFISASRGPVVIGQFSAQGSELDWSQPASTLFPGVDVSPNGGWAGWRSDDDGWAIWLGPDWDTSQTPKEGDVFPLGAVAGVSLDGAARWLRPDRHPCIFALGPVPTLCDGDSIVTSETTASAAPSVMEGVDLVTGATTWTVALDGTIDESDTAETVLHVDDTTYLIAAPEGLVRVDLATGPSPSTDIDAIGWCREDVQTSDPIDDGGTVRDYLRSVGEFPCHLGGERVDEPAQLPVPGFAGVTASGWSAWVVDATVHAARNP